MDLDEVSGVVTEAAAEEEAEVAERSGMSMFVRLLPEDLLPGADDLLTLDDEDGVSVETGLMAMYSSGVVDLPLVGGAEAAAAAAAAAAEGDGLGRLPMGLMTW